MDFLSSYLILGTIKDNDKAKMFQLDFRFQQREMQL
jgi:hypothetical protein